MVYYNKMASTLTRRDAIIKMAMGASALGLSFSANAQTETVTQPNNVSENPAHTTGLQFAILDANSGAVLRHKNGDSKRQPASLTKLMVLGVAFQAIKRPDTDFNLQSIITVPKEAQPQNIADLTGVTDLAMFHLQEGTRYKTRLLLKAIGSRSDAASTVALVNHLGEKQVLGWEGDFYNRYQNCIEQMNSLASTIGMSNTHFDVITGSPNQDNYSTPHDMALLIQYMQDKYPKLCEYALGNPWTNVRPLNQDKRHSSLALRDNPKEIKWSKTGYTDVAGWCEGAYAKIGDNSMVGVVFGAASKSQRKSILLNEFKNAADKIDNKDNNADVNFEKRALFMGLV